MSVLHVERVSGRYIEPEIVDLDDGCLFRIHEEDVGEAGAKWLERAFVNITQWWAVRPADVPLGPVVPVRFERASDLPARFAILVSDTPKSVTYVIDEKADILTQRAAETLSQLATEATPRWWRLPQARCERLNGAN